MCRVACIIVNYKNTADTLATLESINNLAALEQLRVLVIDNEASESSLSELRRFNDFPIEVVESKNNLGFAGGVNLGLKSVFKTKVEYIWLLNNDVIVDKHSLESLLACADANSAGITGSLVCYYPDSEKIWFGGGRLYWPWMVVSHSGKSRYCDQYFKGDVIPRQVSFISGCSMLVRREIFESVNGLDHSLFLYGEDVDLCIKASRLGYRLYLEPKSVVWHKVSQSTGGEFNPVREYYNTRNGYFLIKRHVMPFPVRAFAYLTRSIWDLYRISKSLLATGDSPLKSFPIFFKAVVDFKAERFGPLNHHF